jgi:CRISPR-associated protein Cst2
MKNNKVGVSLHLKFEMNGHALNNAEVLLGNMSQVKRDSEGRAYVSGQMVRHALFQSINRINADHEGTFVSSGNAISWDISKCLRADLGGFLQTDHESNKRVGPVKVSQLKALKPSTFTRDLLTRFSPDGNNSIAHLEFSESDMMVGFIAIDVARVGITSKYEFADTFSVGQTHVRHVTEAERVRRIKLAVLAACNLTDFARQSKNATFSVPCDAVMVLDTIYSHYGTQLTEMSEEEFVEFKSIVESRGGKVYRGLNEITRAAESFCETDFKCLAGEEVVKLNKPENTKKKEDKPAKNAKKPAKNAKKDADSEM